MKNHPGQAGLESSTATSRARGLVLLMDDDDMVRRVTTTMLGHFGYEPVPSADGSEALRKTRALIAEGKQLTAAILDLTVREGAGGRDIVGPLRELLPKLPIVAASGYSNDPIMADPQRFGFSASLHKPFLLDDLGNLLSDVISRPPR
jgi:CheY-like chemotaxis protein